MIQLNSGAASDAGQVRSLNEDSMLTAASLCAVADGMGGHRGGEVASAEATQALQDNVTEPSADGLVAAVQAANSAVFDKALADAGLSGMGTTLCAIGIIDGAEEESHAVAVVNVGDSRVYLHAGDDFVQLTEDHSLVEAMVREGQLSTEEASSHPRRNVVTRALGIEARVDVDCWTVVPAAGDRFLLCSDGLFNEMHDDQIAAVLRRLADPQEAADELVRLANEAGGRDNITVVVADVSDGDEATPGAVSGRVTRVGEPISDLAGLGVDENTAPSRAGGGAVPTSDRQAPAPRRAPMASRWRTALFIGAIVAVFALAFGAVAWSARSTYHVIADDGEVVVMQGPVGGLLWFDPTVEDRTGIDVATLPEAQQRELESGKEQPNRAAADSYVEALSGVVTVTTTTAIPPTTFFAPTTLATTTTAPPAQPAAPAPTQP